MMIDEEGEGDGGGKLDQTVGGSRGVEESDR